MVLVYVESIVHEYSPTRSSHESVSGCPVVHRDSRGVDLLVVLVYTPIIPLCICTATLDEHLNRATVTSYEEDNLPKEREFDQRQSYDHQQDALL